MCAALDEYIQEAMAHERQQYAAERQQYAAERQQYVADLAALRTENERLRAAMK